MFRRTYKVKGEDVDDFMVMHDVAYHGYTSSIFNTFLFQKGYSKHKLDALKTGLQKCNEELIYLKHLMFTQHFSVNLELSEINNTTGKINLRSRFFNSNNELCAMVNTDFYWLNNNSKKEILLPKKEYGDVLI